MMRPLGEGGFGGASGGRAPFVHFKLLSLQLAGRQLLAQSTLTGGENPIQAMCVSRPQGAVKRPQLEVGQERKLESEYIDAVS